jgi:[ribosomal protein S5]-alanine N-acetyltransferase
MILRHNLRETYTTPRLILCKPLLSDARDIFFHYAQDERVTRFLAWTPHQTVNDTKTFLEQCIEGWVKGNWLSWVLSRQPERGAIGMVDLRYDPQTCHAGLGYVLARDMWGHGNMTEAVSKLLGDAFSGPAWLNRVSAYCHPENYASIRVLEKVGMHRERLVPDILPLPNLGPQRYAAYLYIMDRTMSDKRVSEAGS